MTQYAADLSHHLARFKGRRVACVGDVMVDRFIHGDVRRISPEAPVPVLRITSESSQLGGAGNVARNASALGVSVAFFSVIGSDRAGREVTDLLSQLETIESFLRVNADRETTIKNRFFSANGHHLLRADRETAAPLTVADEEDLTAALAREIAQADAVMLSDYGKGVVTESFARAAIGAARDAGKPIVVDPKGTNYKLYDGATVVTPNRAELALVTGRSVESESDLVVAAQALFESVDLGAVLVTRSADGMTLVQRDGQVDHLSAESHEIADVTGAGDTVVATLGAALGAGVGLLDSARLANAAAGVVVKRRGTAVVLIRELAAALLRRDLTAVEAKVADDTTASARAALWRAEGLKIGFTNGCFDLLHPGHVSLLEQAKAASDKLIVGLNSDASVRRLKGPERPIQNEIARATVLASMEAVDLVVVFDDDTPLSLIENLRPDVLVKGADYAKVDIVGSEHVEAYGGRVIRAELVDSVSTTATIAALKEG
jgi:D-beta-D-heptose 7-phosphate kinase / D-beta-D-heptose 1-phosphate adenosyltransferase